MQGRDEKPLAATAVVVGFVLTVALLLRLVGATYEPKTDDRYRSGSALAWPIELAGFVWTGFSSG